MRNSIVLLLAAALSVAAASTVGAQAPDRRSPRGRSTPQKKSDVYVNGPNAAFKNQQRKMTDPLNANGR